MPPGTSQRGPDCRPPSPAAVLFPPCLGFCCSVDATPPYALTIANPFPLSSEACRSPGSPPPPDPAWSTNIEARLGETDWHTQSLALPLMHPRATAGAHHDPTGSPARPTSGRCPPPTCSPRSFGHGPGSAARSSAVGSAGPRRRRRKSQSCHRPAPPHRSATSPTLARPTLARSPAHRHTWLPKWVAEPFR